MQHYSPARLRAPLRRVGPRGSGELQRDQLGRGDGDRHRLAAAMCAQTIRAEARLLHRPRPVPGADRLVGAAVRHAELRRPWRLLFGQHGGRPASTPSAASFWEFGEPDWEHTKLLPACSASPRTTTRNPIKIGLGKLKARGRQVRLGQPDAHRLFRHRRRVVGIRPGTDGLFVLALIHELLAAGKIDLDYLVRYTNAAWLVIDAPGRAPMTGCSPATPTASRWSGTATPEAPSPQRRAERSAGARRRLHSWPTAARACRSSS